VRTKGLLDMPGPKDQQRATTPGEDLISDHAGGVLVARGGNLLPRSPIRQAREDIDVSLALAIIA